MSVITIWPSEGSDTNHEFRRGMEALENEGIPAKGVALPLTRVAYFSISENYVGSALGVLRRKHILSART